jgi:hypothetical protein
VNALPERELGKQQRRAAARTADVDIADAIARLTERTQQRDDVARSPGVDAAAVEAVGDRLGLHGLEDGIEVARGWEVGKKVGGDAGVGDAWFGRWRGASLGLRDRRQQNRETYQG